MSPVDEDDILEGYMITDGPWCPEVDPFEDEEILDGIEDVDYCDSCQ